jgi:3-isopropylmalate/(R)-2-methylmalate dehydratase small subunit
MRPVDVITGTMVPLPRADVDTDQIIPKQFLTRVERTGYGDFLFYDWARDGDGTPQPSFFTNDPARRGARVLVAGDNFGCGSSREHAVWALHDWGFEAVVSSSFADIFRSNAYNVGLLPVEVAESVLGQLLRLATDPRALVTIDLSGQTVTAEGVSAFFTIDPTARHRLLRGLDPIDVTLELSEEIAEHETGRAAWLPTTPQ